MPLGTFQYLNYHSFCFKFGFETHSMYGIGDGVLVDWNLIQKKYKRPKDFPEALSVINFQNPQLLGININ